MIHVDWKSIIEKLTRDRRDLPPMGMRVYIGPQGNGKSLSMVHDGWEMKKRWPKLFVISNMDLTYADVVIHGTKDLVKALSVDNGEDGVLLIVDELQLFASKKQGVGYEVFQGLCQQRKKRRFLMGTAQDWEDVDVSSRKKVKEIVKTKSFGPIQVNQMFDGYTIKYDKQANEWVCKSKGWFIYKRNDKLYGAYDTYAEVSINDEFKDRLTAETFKEKMAIATASREKNIVKK